MKVCLFSDIHGNGFAFKAALPLMLSEKADLYIFLGDLCGYYFDQKEILSGLLMLPNLISVKGNHDQMALDISNGDDKLRTTCFEKYGDSLDRILMDENQSVMTWISQNPATYIDSTGMFYCCHGSPKSPLSDYVYPDSDIKFFLDEDQDIFFLGHTHYPMKRTIGNKLIVNPGSIGQPRKGGWPTYAVIDILSREVVFRDVVYDKKKFINNLKKKEVGCPYIVNVLQR